MIANNLGIEFLENVPCDTRCMACGSINSCYYISAQHALIHDQVSVYSQCSECFSLTLLGEHHDSYQSAFSDEGEARSYLKFYLEIGAGIEQMAEEISAINISPGSVIADVGGGIGLASDFINRTFDSVNAVCFEPNPYGKIKELIATVIELPLDDEWLSKNEIRFDIIYASEVIEHIGNPVDFLLTLKSSLRDENGVFVMTTPDASLINKNSAENILYSRLFPGEHKVIYSRDGINKLFERVKLSRPVFSTRTDTIAFAVREGSDDHAMMLGGNAELLYSNYLKMVVNESGSSVGNPYYDGCAFRLFKFYVNKGNINSVDTLLNESMVMKSLLEHDYKSVAKAVVNDSIKTCNFVEYVSKSHAFLGVFCFYFAIYSIHKYGEDSGASRNLTVALDVLEHEFYLAPIFFIEAASLIPVCMRQLALTEAAQKLSSSSLDYWNRSLNFHVDSHQLADELSCLLRLIVRHVNNGAYAIVGELLFTLNSGRYDSVRKVLVLVDELNVFEIRPSERVIYSEFYASLIHYYLDAFDEPESPDSYLLLSVAAVSDMIMSYPDEVSIEYMVPAIARGGRFLASQPVTSI